MMAGQLLDGRELAKQIKEKLRQEVQLLKEQTSAVPHLVNVILGDLDGNPGALAYASSQKRVAEQLGINYELRNLAQNITAEDLIAHIEQLNQDPNIHGIMIHKPLPENIDAATVANCLDTAKDLEGINVTNIGKMLLGQTEMIPCTPAAVMEHLKASGVDLRGKEIVVVGSSDIVGKPLSLLLLRQMATVTVCHIGTSEAGRLRDHIGRAEILIVAVGKPELVKGDWIKEGAIVIDVGINQVNGKIVGDVEFETAQPKASFITSVPGGVGPVTVVMLMRNGIEAYKLQTGKSKER